MDNVMLLQLISSNLPMLNFPHMVNGIPNNDGTKGITEALKNRNFDMVTHPTADSL